jgi:hypothetical protein
MIEVVTTHSNARGGVRMHKLAMRFQQEAVPIRALPVEVP